jgi:hypothetical protein
VLDVSGVKRPRVSGKAGSAACCCESCVSKRECQRRGSPPVQ